MNNETKKSAIPNLRFPEFQDAGEWEEKKLGKVADLTSSKRVHLSDYVQNGIPFFRGKEISLLRNHELSDDVLYISENHYEAIKEKYGVPEINDILITAVGTLGNVYRVRNSDKFYFKDGNLIWMKNISEDSKFLEILLDAKRHDVFASAIGSSQKALTIERLNKLKFKFPTLPEQQKIADFLSSLDELIAAQFQKLNALKNHKKGLMQQLFPDEDETVPKLRFTDFENAGEWKEKTLEQISPAIFDGTHQTPKYTEGGIPFFSVENLVSGNKNKFISREDYLVATNKNKPEKGDILITRIGNIGFSTIVEWDYEFSIYVTLAVVKKSEKFHSHYLYSYFQSESYQSEIRSKSLLSAVPCKINMDALRKTKVLLPSYLEQQKIANCLSSLDELITAQSQKLNALKIHKKGLMQQLFSNPNEDKIE